MPQLKAKLGEEWIPIGGPTVGVPVGGATGQLLGKTDPADYATAWVDPPAPETVAPWAGTVRAWAVVNADGTLAAGQGFSSAARTGAGGYQLTFATAPASPYAVVVSPSGIGALMCLASPAGGSITVLIWNTSLDGTDAPFQVIVAGGQ
jgi:hypothetical protein